MRNSQNISHIALGTVRITTTYVDDNNLFVIGKNKEDIKSLLLLDFEIVNNWFYENFMILNPEKNHYMCLGKNLDNNEVLNFDNLTIKKTKKQKF